MALVHSLEESAHPSGRRSHGLTDSPRAQHVAIMASRIRVRAVFILLDALVVLGAYGIAELAYLRDKAPARYWPHFVTFVLVALALQLAANHIFGLYGRMWRHAGIEEARQIVFSTASVVALLVALWPARHALGFEKVPLNVVLIGGLLLTAGFGIFRFHSRLFAWQRGAKRMGLRVGVIGTRDAGAAAVKDMMRNPKAGLVPVAVFDDDAKTHGLTLIGVPVVGRISDIPTAASRYGIQQLLLAIPSPSQELVERVLAAGDAAGVAVKVLPGVKELTSSHRSLPAASRSREPRIEDLLGRGQVDIDLESLHRAIAGRRVLVTGAGGSIGTEISRQVSGLAPESLVLLDHD